MALRDKLRMDIEETLSELHFNLSCHTKVLKAKSVFISAYPGFIVFGRAIQKFYPAQTYFKFSPFELHKLYVAIIKILTFFTEENPKEKQGVILRRSESITYFWIGVVLNVNGRNEKIVSFGIETECILKIQMNLSDLHNFITALKSTIVICLCLSTEESEIITAASNLDIDTLLKLKEYSEAKHFVVQFLKMNNYPENQETFKLIQLIHYYFDIIVLVHKFTSMSKFEKNVIEEILSA